ncbi:alanine--tRNA ligase [Kiritimatiella glycovorans]|uniref:Alanine--tRNA ligase n=1 Tax=Kiritimatiella glycovorans TaxID=1307763 RepID=A0A0G3EA49_9BACT|nr:alanine--tRNA ligase [Kiritimatiella glycovorans]AKJ63316.1 Alanine--tRNA ligase [Kiritimatiella glycovorans]
MMTSAEIRASFFDFFREKGHAIVPSAPVVLPTDPTLLFVNAGMNPFKDLFLGQRETKDTRVADTQKCIRVSGKHNDLEEVGRDTYHHTFFEMLGNWSFGDYYKREAIQWAWELLTEVWGLDKNRLWATVFRSDDEAAALWEELTDLDPAHILRFDEKDNFWEMGETGPCGPCSEIHYDATPGGDAPAEAVNAGRPDVIEIWNLVFIQHNRRADGTLEDLAVKHIDTGMGFERITAVLQGKSSNYDTDIFAPLIEKLKSLSGKDYEGEHAVAMRVAADHVRTLSVAIADGVLPSNDGRGYVLRRLLRRAVRYGRTLGFDRPFLGELFPVVESQFAKIFPEIRENRKAVLRALKAEEESFLKTLDRGIALFEDTALKLEREGFKDFPGEEAFKLYDTYGFPVDLTALMASERGFTLDENRFRELMDEQRARARAASKAGGGEEDERVSEWTARGLASAFTGYESHQTETTVLEVPDRETVLLAETPFYAESGGQLADLGWIRSEDAEFEVHDAVRPAEGLIVHHGRFTRGGFKPGDRVTAAIDHERRQRLRRHHTATHLLHRALRECVDASIRQAGSMVAPDRLRFDFNYFESVDAQMLREIEARVNAWVIADTPVETYELPFREVREREDITAVFDEKYGDTVRVVDVDGVSRELCGGTHVGRTGEIGLFRIVAESSVASGIRRIEAACGMGAWSLARDEHEILSRLSTGLGVPAAELPERVDALQTRCKRLEKELREQRKKDAAADLDAILQQRTEVEGVPLIAAFMGELPMDALRHAQDNLRHRFESGVIVLGSHSGGKACFTASASRECTDRGVHAGNLLGTVAKIAKGGGGGKPDRAQAGGKDPSKVDDAIGAVPEALRSMLSQS